MSRPSGSTSVASSSWLRRRGLWPTARSARTSCVWRSTCGGPAAPGSRVRAVRAARAPAPGRATAGGPAGPDRRRARPRPSHRRASRARISRGRASVRRTPARSADARAVPRRQAGRRPRRVQNDATPSRRGARDRGEPRAPCAEHAILRQDPALAVSQAAWPALRPARKTVTVLVAEHGDPSGELDPEALDRLFERRLDLIRVSVERHGGAAERLVGDTVIAVFGVPVAHEDDALRAVRAACDFEGRARRAGAANGPSTGEVYVADPAGRSPLVTGAPVSAAKRLAQAASPGEVHPGRRRFGSFAVLPRSSLRTRSGRGPSSRCRSSGCSRSSRACRQSSAGSRRRSWGASGELAELRRALDAVRGERRCCVVTVLGEAGSGKRGLSPSCSPKQPTTRRCS